MFSDHWKFAGQYKETNYKIEKKLKGNQPFRFTPITVKETSLCIQQLTNAYIEAKENPKINKLLLVPCVVFDFLCIYPFMKGNGRMSRLLSLLLLYKNGFDGGRYISFEEKVCLSKDKYFASIRESSNGWHENENSYFPFMTHFLNTLLFCYQELDTYKGEYRHRAGNSKQVPKSQQIRNYVLNSIIPISKKEICVALPDVSPSTIESVLGLMVKEGVVEIVDKGPNTKYIKMG